MNVVQMLIHPPLAPGLIGGPGGHQRAGAHRDQLSGGARQTLPAASLNASRPLVH